MDDNEWTLVLPRMQLGPHREHAFQLENVDSRKFTHLRLTIYPDGGVKRVRVMGRRDAAGEQLPTRHTSGTKGVHTTNGASESNGANTSISNSTNGTHDTNGLNGNGSDENVGVKLNGVDGANGM